MKALKVLVIMLLATFSYQAASAQTVHHRRHHKVVKKHHRMHHVVHHPAHH